MQENELLEEFEQGRLLILVENEDEFNALMRYLEDNSNVQWMSGLKPTERDYSFNCPHVYMTSSMIEIGLPLRMCRTVHNIKPQYMSIFASKFMNQFDCQQNDSFVPLDMSQLFEE